MEEKDEGEGPSTSKERSTSSTSTSTRSVRDKRYRDAHRDEIRQRDRGRKHVGMDEETFLRLEGLQANFTVKTSGEVNSRLIDR